MTLRWLKVSKSNPPLAHSDVMYCASPIGLKCLWFTVTCTDTTVYTWSDFFGRPPLPVLLVSSIKWYKSLILEISINGRNSLRSELPSFLSSSLLVESRRGLRSIVCSPKYTKLAAYLLISVHDPDEILSVRPRLAPAQEFAGGVSACLSASFCPQREGERGSRA